MSFDVLAESCKSLLAMPTAFPSTGSIPAAPESSVDVDKPPSFQFVSASPKIERKPLAVPLMSGLNDWHQSETGRLHRIGFAVNPIGTGSGKEDRVMCGIATFYPLLRMANVTAWIKSAATRRIGNPAPRMLKASNVRYG